MPGSSLIALSTIGVAAELPFGNCTTLVISAMISGCIRKSIHFSAPSGFSASFGIATMSKKVPAPSFGMLYFTVTLFFASSARDLAW
ncbi:hypothetical protein D9M71_677440 [compost metagenome]